MNERVRALAEQADAYSDAMDIGGKNYIGLRDEYFAELIVKECEKVSLKNSHRNDDMGAIIARQIKQHFGMNNERTN